MLYRFMAGLLLACALFAPLSVSLNTQTYSSPITVHVQKAEAAIPLLIPGAIALASALGVGAWVSNTVADWINSVFAFIGSLFVRLAVSILGLAGALFDYSIWAFASNLTGTLDAMGIVDAIKRIWVVFRDLSQIVLIGFFIFIAINIILNNHEYSIKQHAVRAILVALFMNFSLFFSMAVIDVSNFVAYQFYRGISSVGGASTQSNPLGTEANISERIATSLGLTQLNNWSSWAGQDLKRGGILETVVASVGVTITLLITALVLLYAVWLLLRRAVMLILIMLTSSLAVAALIIPKFQSYFKEWRTALLGNAFFAPLLLLMLWTVIQIMDVIAASNLPGLRPETFVQPNAIQASGSALARYGVVIGLLIAAIKIADTLARKGSELFGMNVGGTSFGGVLGAVAGGPTGFALGKLRSNRAGKYQSELERVNSGMKAAGASGDLAGVKKFQDERAKLQKRIDAGGGMAASNIDKILSKINKAAGGKDAKKDTVKDIIKKNADEKKKKDEADTEANKLVEPFARAKLNEEDKVKGHEANEQMIRAAQDSSEKIAQEIKGLRDTIAEKENTVKLHESDINAIKEQKAQLEKEDPKDPKVEAALKELGKKEGELKSQSNHIEELRKQITQGRNKIDEQEVELSKQKDIVSEGEGVRKKMREEQVRADAREKRSQERYGRALDVVKSIGVSGGGAETMARRIMQSEGKVAALDRQNAWDGRLRKIEENSQASAAPAPAPAASPAPAPSAGAPAADNHH